jgi:GT2 family glycosyltransferase/glycosyltransferase involved in cell wall biosynthesis
VSVVVVNLNGRPLLAECFDSILAQDYPSTRLEIILVDNASADDSVAFTRRSYPSIRVVEAGHNLGFAGGSNLGADTAQGDYLAFLNNDARAHPRWLRALWDILASGDDVSCAASKILDQSGRAIDFVGTAMNLYGRAFQIDEGMPVVTGLYDKPCELLAPCGGAMMIGRELFRQVGGFDEDYVAYYEDVDLGWRLWLYGHRVLLAPESIVYHRKHQTGSSFPVEQRYVLSEVNALRTQIKNLEEKNLWQVLCFSLLMGVKRSVEQAGLDREGYELGYERLGEPQSGAFESEPKMTRVATSYLVAIDQVAEEMPRLMAKRQRIQESRARSDEQIFERFPIRPDNPIFPWRRYQVVQEQLVSEMGIPDSLKPQRGSRLLIVTDRTLGSTMSGPAVRAWEIACALSEQFEVILAAPGQPARQHPKVRLVGYGSDEAQYAGLDPYVVNADVVLATGSVFSTIERFRDLGKPTIVDLSDPFTLRKVSQSHKMDVAHQIGDDVESIIRLRLEGSIGDFFVCASEQQRSFWLGMLLSVGRVNTVTYAQDPTLRALIDVVPYGISAEPPHRQEAVLKGVHPGINLDDRLILWNDGWYQWSDPLTLLEALKQVLAERQDVKLYFAVTEDMSQSSAAKPSVQEQALARCRDLGLLDRHVFFGDRIPYDERASYLLEADLAVSIHRPSLESTLTPQAWVPDCAWAGLPVLSTAGDPLLQVLADQGLGCVLPPGQPDLLSQAILEWLEDDRFRRRVTGQTEGAQTALSWQQCVRPVLSFLEKCAFAPDALDAARQAAQTRQVSNRIQSLEQVQDQLDAVMQGRVMRLVRGVNIALGRE